MTISFENKVVIVTGSGGGLGRCHALQFAQRGAKLVINDLGGAVDGSGGSSEAADKVVQEIKDIGGEAISNGSSVTDKEGVQKLVDDAMSAYGRIDVLVNNAGVLRDKSFAKVTLDDFEFVVDVHLMGSVYCSKAVWPIMVEQQYGRIIMTSSSSGVFGNFGQANYGSAKLGVVGLMNTLRIEGQKNNIKVNSLIPVAATRMTENLGMPEEVLKQLKPESVSPAVLFMASEDAPNGIMLSAGAGVFAKVEISQAAGVGFAGDDINPDSIADHWSEISDMTSAKQLFNGGEHTAAMFTKVKK
ncbi:SDR family NAD(P)-dependent oxidoreductase [Pelagibacteraceae bacterium]|nr:SDR family NAD(P)-dependent oxidoreductase [Pelagibacteraceae bacterium]